MFTICVTSCLVSLMEAHYMAVVSTFVPAGMAYACQGHWRRIELIAVPVALTRTINAVNVILIVLI